VPKETPKGMTSLKGHLINILPSSRPHPGMSDYNLCDAAIAAYTASLYRQDEVDAIANCGEALVSIPSP